MDGRTDPPIDGITFQRFKLGGWDLVQCLLISFCFGSEVLRKIGKNSGIHEIRENPEKIREIPEIRESCQRFE